jgi:hypothetical protein
LGLLISSSADAKPPVEREWRQLSAPINVKNPHVDRFAAEAAKKMQTVIVRLKASAGRKVQVLEQQDAFLARTMRLGGNTRVLARTQIVLNAIFLEATAKTIAAMARDPLVESINYVRDYPLDLAETVPYIGASAVHGLGFDGSGVRVAVLDSGIDYKHAAFDGSGDPAEYEADDPTIIEPGSFPTARVVGGFDFVGQVWPNGPLAPDPDPIDHGGHGTHVADIIGGNLGVAPGVSLYAYQVCSAVASSCSGVALIQAMEAAVDPNGDGNTSDHVDIIHMSLGSSFGQPFDDDLAVAVDNATTLGVLTVCSAGNSADHPYVTGTPGAARTALSVAQTAVPSEQLQLITVIAPPASAGDYVAVHQLWSADLTATIEGPVVYGNGSGGNLNGCAAFPAGSLAGQIVFVDRGACNFSLKIQNIEAAGGILGIIGLITPEEPFSGAFGGGTPPAIPAFMVHQSTGNIFRAGGAFIRVDPANVLPLAGSMASTSSRGPRNGDNLLKPEIGAPGASVSAVAGSGTETAAFGGTSGAAPMVTGSAALLMQGRSAVIPPTGHTRALAVKALLMNSAETDIRRDYTGVLAEISRIGSGEVRVDRAIASPVAIFGVAEMTPALSLGFVDAGKNTTLIRRKVKIVNFTSNRILYTVSSSYRYADDQAAGGVLVQVPNVVNANARGFTEIDVTFAIVGSALSDNGMTSGDQGADPATLTAQEYDGYITFDDGVNPVHIPWHVLPRKSADVQASPNTLAARPGPKQSSLFNHGPGNAQNEAFSLIAVSANIPSGPPGTGQPTPDLRAVGVNTTPVPAGFCSENDSFVWSFAINTHERQTHLLPVINAIDIDVDRDGVYDYEIANYDLTYLQTGTTLGGIEVTWAFDLATGAASGFFYTEHATNTANTVLRVCAEQIGMSAADLGVTQVDAAAFSYDFYFGGPGDTAGGMVLMPGGEQYVGTVDATIAPLSLGTLNVADNGARPGASAELGQLVITNSDFGVNARGGATKRSEALVLPIRGVPLPW